MSQLSSVLVAVDFSPTSRRGLDVATALCVRAGVPLQLLHVWNPNHLIGAGALLTEAEPWVQDLMERLRAKLDDWAADARRSGAEASAKVVEGVASRVIPEVARSSRAGLVVVGRRGAARLSHVLLGSVSERVVHHSPCPVLVVPEKTAEPLSPQRLLVGIDFSHESRDAYHVALGLAEQLGARGGVLLIHTRPGERELYLQNWSELAYRGEYPYDRAALEAWAELDEEQPVPVEARVLEGDGEQLLVRTAKEKGCEWLVVGLQGRTALASLLIGSTTDRILKLTDRPVLVVPTTSDPPGESTS